MLAKGEVSRDERGRYRLGPSSQPALRRVTSWRDLERQSRRWEGGWIGVQLATPSGDGGRAERNLREQSLRFLGFRRLVPALAVRPDNLRARVGEIREELAALGLPKGDLVFELRALDEATERSAHRLWDDGDLRGAYRRLLSEIEKSARRLPDAPHEEAMVESFLLGGRAIRLLVLDPLLPDAIFPGDERRALTSAMRRYDRIGRAVWAAFLERFDVPHLRSPVDTHGGRVHEAALERDSR
jgi:phenylacetic acid degradation operon negative regulatory protein